MGFVDTDSSTLSPSQAPSTISDDESSPFVNHADYADSPKDLRTPTTKNNDLLSATRLRRKGITESEEIWEELEDDPLLPPLSPFAQRRVTSIDSTPPKGVTNDDVEGDDSIPHEGTSLLGVTRRGTGRTYRSVRRRSAPILTRDEEQGRTQEATGGWWKMAWWGGGGDEGKGKGRSVEDEGDGGDDGGRRSM